MTIFCRSLQPWTLYKIQVSAYTNQVPNGYGPFSLPIDVLTLEDLPGPINNLVIMSSTPESVQLAWDPPDNPNGELTGYVVYILDSNKTLYDTSVVITDNLKKDGMEKVVSPEHRTTYFSSETQETRKGAHKSFQVDTSQHYANQLDHSSILRRALPHVLSNQYSSGDFFDYGKIKNQTEPLFTNSTVITVTNMDPDLTYSISIMAVNSMGKGKPVSVAGVRGK